MRSQRLTVTIPKPCHADWQTMTPSQKGRFCGSCAETVVDFTKMSDAETVRWLTENKETSCGRFRSDQIGKELVALSANRNYFTWRALVFAFSAWFSAKPVEGKETLEFQTENQTQTSQKQPFSEIPKIIQTSDTLRAFTGKVLDSLTKEPIQGVSVILKGTTIGAGTNAIGNFSFELPNNLSLESAQVVVSSIGYNHHVLKLQDISQPVIIYLTIDHRPLLGEIVIVKPYSPRGLWHKFINLFR
jgi:hypothetical protein